MGFDKPLQLFVSYSHDDDKADPSALDQFRCHLAGLKKEGWIEIFWDGRITAGEIWDAVIERELENSQIFLALSGPGFNVSEYIQEKELPTATARQERGECMILSVMWREWSMPADDPLRKRQFLYGPDKAVQSATNFAERDRIFRGIIDGLRATIQKSVNTPSPASGRPQARARVPIEVAYRCDWDKPVQTLVDGLGAGDPCQPAVVALIGDVDDCAQQFLDRVHRRELLDALRAPRDSVVSDIQPCDWPTDVRSFLYGISPGPGGTVADRIPEGLTVWTVTVDRWDRRKHQLLRDIVQDLRQPHWTLAHNQRLVVALSIFQDTDKGLETRIRTLLSEAPGLPSAVIGMPSIERDQARNWARKPEVYKTEYYSSLVKDIDQIFGGPQGSQPMRMGHLAPRLRDLLEKYRDKGAA